MELESAVELKLKRLQEAREALRKKREADKRRLELEERNRALEAELRAIQQVRYSVLTGVIVDRVSYVGNINAWGLVKIFYGVV